jgi:hypothetical protein
MLWTGPRREVCLFSILMTPSRVALPAIDCHPLSGMRSLSVLLCVVWCSGCICIHEPRQPRICEVVDADGFRPINGATVWMQPYAPFHPFWPPGDKGITNANGQAVLSLPWNGDFWFYFSSVKAVGYHEYAGKELDDPRLPGEIWSRFYMKRDSAKNAR